MKWKYSGNISVTAKRKDVWLNCQIISFDPCEPVLISAGSPHVFTFKRTFYLFLNILCIIICQIINVHKFLKILKLYYTLYFLMQFLSRGKKFILVYYMGLFWTLVTARHNDDLNQKWRYKCVPYDDTSQWR